MVIAVYSFEGQYQGLHGICSHDIIQVDSIKEAREFASEMSRDVMNDYGDIMDEFYSQALDEGLEEGSDEFEEYVAECVDENVCYQLWRVTDIYASIEQMSRDFYMSPDEFVRDHCVEVDF
jgi:hypothetical protein